jgi:hypothetical protein
MYKTVVFAISLAIILLLPSMMFGDTIKPGSGIKIEDKTGRIYLGFIDAISQDSIGFRTEQGVPNAIAKNNISHLSISKDQPFGGARIGLAVGLIAAGAYIVVDYLSHDDENGDFHNGIYEKKVYTFDNGRRLYPVPLIILSAGVIGGVIGSSMHKYESIPVNDIRMSTQIGIDPAKHGIGIKLAAKF